MIVSCLQKRTVKGRLKYVTGTDETLESQFCDAIYFCSSRSLLLKSRSIPFLFISKPKNICLYTKNCILKTPINPGPFFTVSVTFTHYMENGF